MSPLILVCSGGLGGGATDLRVGSGAFKSRSESILIGREPLSAPRGRKARSEKKQGGCAFRVVFFLHRLQGIVTHVVSEMQSIFTNQCIPTDKLYSCSQSIHWLMLKILKSVIVLYLIDLYLHTPCFINISVDFIEHIIFVADIAVRLTPLFSNGKYFTKQCT